MLRVTLRGGSARYPVHKRYITKRMQTNLSNISILSIKPSASNNRVFSRGQGSADLEERTERPREGCSEKERPGRGRLSTQGKKRER